MPQGAPEWSAERITEVFTDYVNTVGKDKDDFGGHLRWQVYNQECTQLITDYNRLMSPNHTMPTTPEGRKALADVMDRLKFTIDSYKAERAEGVKIPKEANNSTRPPKKNPEKADVPADFDWVKATNDVFAKYSVLDNKNADRLGIANLTAYKKYKAKADAYLDIYTKYLDQEPRDEKMLRTTVWEMKNLMESYLPEKDVGAGVAADVRDEKIKKIFEIDPDAAMAGLAFFVGGREKKINDKFVSLQESKTKSIDARQGVYELADYANSAALNKDQLESVLFLKAHLKDIAGEALPGENGVSFNRADIPSVAAAVQSDLLYNHPDQLYADIVKEQGETLTEDDKLGLRLMIDQYNGINATAIRGRRVNTSKMLATPAEHRTFDNDLQRLISGRFQIAEGEQKLAKGQRMVDMLTFRNIPISQRIFGRPFRNFIARKVTVGAGELARGKAEYFAGLSRKLKFDQSKLNLPGNVQAGISGKIVAEMDKAHIGNAFETDATPRLGLTKKLADDMAVHAANLDSIGADSLDDIMIRTNHEIKTVTNSGLNEDTLNWMLKSQNGRAGSSGIPSGVMLRMTPLSEDKLAELKAKKTKKVNEIVQGQ